MHKTKDKTGTGSSPSSLSMEHLMQMACQKTNLFDWGDKSFRYPLGKLLEFFDEMYPGDVNKRFSFAYTIADILAKRLYIQDNFKSYPEISVIPVERPLFITGLPRTGTTLIHHLISRDSIWRVLLYWELLYPYQRMDIENFEAYAVNLTEQGLKALYSLRPEFIYRHETKATGPEECFNLLRITFYNIAWPNEWYLTNYLEWFLQQDMADSYRYYKKLLQLLLWRKPGNHLLLKCPAHLFNVDAIFNVFPDANVIWMHRNPCKSIASGLSLLSVFHDLSTGPDEFINLYMEYFKQSLHKAMEIEQSGTSQLRSISYRELIRQPLEMIRDIYHRCGYPWDNSKEKSILKWLADNPQHKHGTHKYSLEDFGFTETDIRNRFSEYFDTYGHLI
jgi:hypothetical protein